MLRKKKKGELREIGNVEIHPGRIEKLLARFQVPHQNRQHEGELTEAVLSLIATNIERGWETDQYRSDLVFWIDDDRHRLEWSRGTMGISQEVDRLKQYVGCPDLVWWVCHSESRMAALRAKASEITEVRGLVLFTTKSEFFGHGPHAAIWIDCDGKAAAVPRPRGGG